MMHPLGGRGGERAKMMTPIVLNLQIRGSVMCIAHTMDKIRV